MIIDENYKRALEKAAELPEDITKDIAEPNDPIIKYIVMLISSLRVLGYALLHEEELFNKTKIFVTQNFTSDFYKKKLNTDQLYDVLCMLDEDCLGVILNDIKGPDSIYNMLSKAIKNKDKSLFEETINNGITNTEPITPMCNCLQLLNTIYNIYDQMDSDYDKIEGDDEEKVQVLFNNWQARLFYKLGQALDSPDFSNGGPMSKFAKEGFQHGKDFAETNQIDSKLFISRLIKLFDPNCDTSTIPWNDFSELIYKVLLYGFMSLKKSVPLCQYTTEVLKDIVLVPEYESIWGQYANDHDAPQKIEQNLNEQIDSLSKYVPVLNKLFIPTADVDESHTKENSVGDANLLEPGAVEIPSKVIEDTTEEDNLLEVITEIIEAIEDQIKEPYNKERVIMLFQELFDGNDYEYKRTKEYLIERGNHLKYKNICIAHISYIFGYLMAKEVFYDSATNLARLIKALIAPRDTKKTTDNIRSYIQSSKNNPNIRLNIAQTKLFDQLLANI